MKTRLALLTLALSACTATVAAPPSPAPSSSASIVGRVRTPEPVTALAVGDGSIWVAVADDDVLRIDPGSEKIIARISHRDGQLPGGASQISILGEEVWTAVPIGSSPPGGFGPGDEPDPDVRTVYEDFEPREADLLEVETLGGLARLDASANRTVGTVLFLDVAPTSIAVTDGGVWVASDRGARRFDPSTARFDEPVPGTAGSLIAVDEALWVWSDDRIARLDPATGATGLTITAASMEVEQINTIAVDEDTVLVSSGTEVLEVDGQGGDVRARARLDDVWQLAVGDGAYAAVSGFGRTFHQLDPETLTPISSVTLGEVSVDGGGLAIFDGHAWVAHRARVLKIALA